MDIGVLDLVVIYSIPFFIIGISGMVFLLALYIVVKKDIGQLDLSEDIRYNIQLRKHPLKFSIFVQVIMFENGVQAALLYRFGRYLHLHGLKSIATLLHKLGKYLTNIDVPPTAKLGPGIVFLHGCNIVLTPYSEAGSHVIFRPWSGMRGWGTVKLEDGVRIGLQSVVLDCVTMGRNSESGPGTVMIRQDVPADNIAVRPGMKVAVLPKPKTKLEGVVIELENVLLEPTEIFKEGLRDALEKAGKKMPVSSSAGLERLPPARIIHNQLGKEVAKREEVLAAYVSAVRARLRSDLRLRPCGKELMERIRERGLKVAVISHQPDMLAREIARSLDLDSCLDFICGADDCLSEWKPEPWIVFRPMRELKIGAEHVIYVGGTQQDLQAGIAAAVRMYWVIPAGDVRGSPRGPVDRFDNLESVLDEFSKPRLPGTI
jgi:serine O-acetyltransferase